MKIAIVKSSQLGTNCWNASRFRGGRCQRVLFCTYPEKVGCKAVQTEIDYLNKYYATLIDLLQNQHTRALATLVN